jgi:UDP-N-acetylmuramoyl-L-alanyl-D-glutamate--2,6-diaminopimelate ligase
MSEVPVPTATLLQALPDKTVLGALPSEVAGLSYDSRKVTRGGLFVAVPGLKQDGRRFIGEALARGAAAVVLDGPDVLAGSDTGRVLVPSAREALARLADAYFGHPSRALAVVGITGTNGKTTTSILVDALLRTGGRPSGLIGTIEYRIGDERVAAGQTTPEALELQGLLARMVSRGVFGAAMEVSSHALALHRPDGIEFDVAVFTNLTQDHLDFHGTLDAYRDAKARLFRLLAAGVKPRRTAVINADDPSGASMTAGLDVPVLTFGLRAGADIRPRHYRSDMGGIDMEVETPRGPVRIASPLVGEHNVMNLLGAIGVGLALDMDRAAIADALGSVRAVPGRFERVEAGQPFLVVVDYAHTPDALDRVLTTARKLVGSTGRLAAVFGCGGDRDRGKRPIMGEIATRIADRVWVTSDNPRTERPDAIVAEIVAGIPADRRERHVAVTDRRAAIRDALAWGRAGDVVVIAGKGHEPYQIVGTEVLPFDDRQEARAALERPGRGGTGAPPSAG